MFQQSSARMTKSGTLLHANAQNSGTIQHANETRSGHKFFNSDMALCKSGRAQGSSGGAQDSKGRA